MIRLGCWYGAASLGRFISVVFRVWGLGSIIRELSCACAELFVVSSMRFGSCERDALFADPFFPCFPLPLAVLFPFWAVVPDRGAPVSKMVNTLYGLLPPFPPVGVPTRSGSGCGSVRLEPTGAPVKVLAAVEKSLVPINRENSAILMARLAYNMCPRRLVEIWVRSVACLIISVNQALRDAWSVMGPLCKRYIVCSRTLISYSKYWADLLNRSAGGLWRSTPCGKRGSGACRIKHSRGADPSGKLSSRGSCRAGRVDSGSGITGGGGGFQPCESDCGVWCQSSSACQA